MRLFLSTSVFFRSSILISVLILLSIVLNMFTASLFLPAAAQNIKREYTTQIPAYSPLFQRAFALGILPLARGPGTMGSGSLAEYSAQCEHATGISIRTFSCSDGVEVPGQGSEPAGNSCAAPNVLNRQCDPGSRFQVLPGRSEDAVAVAHCRKVGLPIEGREYRDIAIIQHNKRNGAVCFYQALGSALPGDGIPAPGEGENAPWSDGQAHWLTPVATQAIGCTGCHDNGGFIRSNYIAQLTTAPHAMPSVADGFNNLTTPLRFVGQAFENDRSWSIETEPAPNDDGSNCIGCHRLAVNNFPEKAEGTAADFGVRATAEFQDSKLPHGPGSPIWMRPNQIFFDAGALATAIKYQECAIAFRESNFESPAENCQITPLGLPWAVQNSGDTGELSSMSAAIEYYLFADQPVGTPITTFVLQ